VCVCVLGNAKRAEKVDAAVEQYNDKCFTACPGGAANSTSACYLTVREPHPLNTGCLPLDYCGNPGANCRSDSSCLRHAICIVPASRPQPSSPRDAPACVTPLPPPSVQCYADAINGNPGKGLAKMPTAQVTGRPCCDREGCVYADTHVALYM